MTRAAKELHLTQSGVSQQIKALEEVLNVTLFDRINRRIIPTNSADILYKECSRRLNALEKTLSSLSHRGNSLVGEVRVGVGTPFGHDLTLTATKSFVALHDRVSFDFVNAPMNEINQLLSQGKLDFAVTDIPSQDETWRYSPIGHELLYMVCPNEKPFRRLQTEGYVNFAGMNLVSYHHHWDIVGQWFRLNFNEAPLTRSVRAKVSDCDTAMKLTASGIGSALLPYHLAKHAVSLHANELCMPAGQSPVKVEIGLYVLKLRSLSPAAQFYFDKLRQYANEEA